MLPLIHAVLFSHYNSICYLCGATERTVELLMCKSEGSFLYFYHEKQVITYSSVRGMNYWGSRLFVLLHLINFRYWKIPKESCGIDLENNCSEHPVNSI